MTIQVVAQHVPLILNAANATAPAPSPAPIPSPAPPPPNTRPPTFVVQAVPSAQISVGVALSPVLSLATISTPEALVALQFTGVPSGCALALVGSPPTQLTLTGTPTVAAPTIIQVVYVRNDSGRLVLGSSRHVVDVIDPAALLVISPAANVAARVGQAVDVVLCTQSITKRAVVVASVSRIGGGFNPIDDIRFTWTPGSPSSSGQLKLVGTPTLAGSFTLQVDYYEQLRLIGTSVHQLEITPSSTVAPPPPPPSPPPPPPPPAPGPPPPPAPAPAGSDALWNNVLMLNRFDASDAGDELRDAQANATATGNEVVCSPDGLPPTRIVQQLVDIRPNPNRGLNEFTGNLVGQNGSTLIVDPPYIAPSCIVYYRHRATTSFRSLRGPTLAGEAEIATSATRECALLQATSLAADMPTAWNASQTAMTVDVFAAVNLGSEVLSPAPAWRFTPLVSAVNGDGSLVWSLGLASGPEASNVSTRHVVRAMLWRATASGGAVVVTSASEMPAGVMVHVCGQWGPQANARHGVWIQGIGGAASVVMSATDAGIQLTAGARLRVGGGVPAFSTASRGAFSVLPLRGRVDELRITAAARYSFAAGATADIAYENRQPPWPNY